MRIALLLTILACSASARAQPQAPPSDTRAADGPPAATVDEARELLAKSTAALDADEAAAYARRALPALDRTLEASPDDCWTLLVAAEARIRARLPKEAKLVVGRAMAAECDEAAVSSLAAWATEYAPDGTRRGPGAKLDRAEALYLHAAALYGADPASVDLAATAIGSAADVALARGEAARAQELALQALRGTPSRDLRTRSGVLFLRAAGPRIGEGAATDVLAPLVDKETLRAILDARVADLQKELARKPGDPDLEVAAAFYSLFTGGDLGIALALRHAREAARSGRKLLELEYLQGRIANEMDDPDEAKRHYRLQIAEFPDAAVTRLAANDLALLLVAKGGAPEEMADALRALDAALARSPDEAALHDTRAQLLGKLGRSAEALQAMEEAHRLEPTEERGRMLAAWRVAGAGGK